MTFRAVLQLLENVRVGWFVLENVDMDESPDGNLNCILQALDNLGFRTRAYKMLSSDFGSPQRRLRLYFCGISRTRYPEFNMNHITDVLNHLNLKCQEPETRMNFIYFIFLTLWIHTFLFLLLNRIYSIHLILFILLRVYNLHFTL